MLSRAAKQGQGVTPPFKPNPMDVRIMGLGTLSLSTCILLIASVSGLPLIEVQGPDQVVRATFGDINMWKFDFNRETLANFGVADENNRTTAKAVGIRHTTGSTHKEAADEISRGSPFCEGNTFTVCSTIRDVNRMFISGQGLILSAMGVSFGILTLVPLTGIRVANQAFIYFIFSVAVAALVIAATGHFVHKLEGNLDDVFNSIYPGIDVAYEWKSGAICLFIAAGFAGISFILSGILTAWCWNSPYGPGEGPNYSEENVCNFFFFFFFFFFFVIIIIIKQTKQPMPPHFLPRTLPPEVIEAKLADAASEDPSTD